MKRLTCLVLALLLVLGSSALAASNEVSIYAALTEKSNGLSTVQRIQM